MKTTTEDNLTVGCAIALLAAGLVTFGLFVWALIELVKWVTTK